MNIWRPKKKKFRLEDWAQEWGQWLYADITLTDRYFQELSALLEIGTQ